MCTLFVVVYYENIKHYTRQVADLDSMTQVCKKNTENSFQKNI